MESHLLWVLAQWESDYQLNPTTLVTSEAMSHLERDGSFLGHGLIDTIEFHVVVQIIHWTLKHMRD